MEVGFLGSASSASLDSVQGLQRIGYRHLSLAPSGAVTYIFSLVPRFEAGYWGLYSLESGASLAHFQLDRLSPFFHLLERVYLRQSFISSWLDKKLGSVWTLSDSVFCIFPTDNRLSWVYDDTEIG